MELKVADQAWIAGAILQRNHPERTDFSVGEIRKQAEREFGALRPGVYQHIVNHGLAQATPAPATYRLFTQTERGRRRLFRPGDTENAGRRSGKTHPDPTQLPEKYRGLVDWYEKRYLTAKISPSGSSDGSTPIAVLAFVGLIPAYDLTTMANAIEQDCERIEDDRIG